MSPFNPKETCKVFKRRVVLNEQQNAIRSCFLHVAIALIIVPMYNKKIKHISISSPPPRDRDTFRNTVHTQIEALFVCNLVIFDH